jgi:hypothetical protein
MPMNHPDVVSQCLSLSFELKGVAAFILTWMQAFLLLSNEPGANCFIETLNASPVVNSPGETGATYTCGARVPRNRDTYTTT